MSRRGDDGLWVQRLYGQELRSLTPPHGLVGNVQALLPLLDRQRGSALKREAGSVLAENVVLEEGLANWPPRPRPELPGPDGQIRVQWCAGSPGIVIGAADYLDEELLRAGAELPWRAGPPAHRHLTLVALGRARFDLLGRQPGLFVKLSLQGV